MKRLILSALALLGIVNVQAVDFEPEKGFTTQITLGMNVSQIRGTVFDINPLADGWVDPRAKVGLNVGINGRLMLPEAHGTYLMAGVEWSQKGGKYSRPVTWVENEVTYSTTHKFNMHYINIPVHVGYHYNFDRDWGVYGEFGPYFAVGVCGKNKMTTGSDGREANEMEDALRYNVFNKTSSNKALGGFQRFDCGLGLRFGGEYKGVYSVNLGLDWGLTDMLRDEYRDDYFDEKHVECGKLKNFNMSLTLGYRF